MVHCWAPLCSHNSMKDTCLFFRFPSDKKELRAWESIIRRSDSTPTVNSRLCSCHFKNNLKENGPSIFAWNEKVFMNFRSPEKIKRKRKNLVSDDLCNDTNSNCGGDTDLLSAQNNSLLILSNNSPVVSNTHFSNAVADSEIYFLNQTIENLKIENKWLKNQIFGYHSICENEDIFIFYTGISKDMFDIIVDLSEVVEFEYYNGWKVECFSIKDQILLTFIKLRLNLLNKDLAFRFNTSESTVCNIILTFIIVLHEILFNQLMKTVPSQSKNKLCLPNCFVSFQNCRITIDCTEVTCDIPHQLDHQRATFSSYKHKNTLKRLIGVAPNGVITFVSKLYPGSTSDKKIVSHCGILSLFEPGDLILADKGFLISDLIPNGVSLNIPPFLTSSQFTPSEVERTKTIARARIHVERAISRIKGFKILSHIPKSLYKKSSMVFQLCASLVNFQNPLIREVESLFIVSAPEHNGI